MRQANPEVVLDEDLEGKEVYTEAELELHNEHFEVRPSLIPGAGLGCFAKKDLPDTEWVGAMRGPIVGNNGKHVLWNGTPNGYTLVDIKGPLRFANHSRNPNLELDREEDESYSVTHVWTLRAIKKGEEILWDYGFEQEDLDPEFDDDIFETDLYELSPLSIIEWLRGRNMLEHVLEIARYLDDESQDLAKKIVKRAKPKKRSRRGRPKEKAAQGKDTK